MGRQSAVGTVSGASCRDEHLAVSSPSRDLPDFVARHIGPCEADVAAMLEVVGQQQRSTSLARHAQSPVPSAPSGPSHIDAAPSEAAVIEELRVAGPPQPRC